MARLLSMNLLDAPDLGVRTSLLKRAMGQPLNARELKRLAQRQGVENETLNNPDSPGAIRGGRGAFTNGTDATPANAVNTARAGLAALPATATREQRIAAAKSAGTFDLLKRAYNTGATGADGKAEMDDAGNIKPFTREQNVARAMEDGTFEAKRKAYNKTKPRRYMSATGAFEEAPVIPTPEGAMKNTRPDVPLAPDEAARRRARSATTL